MREITEQVSFFINGEAFLWMPGSKLIADVPMREESGMIEIHAASDSYILNSPASYKVNRVEGLDLILLFKKADDMPDLMVESHTELPETPSEPEEITPVRTIVNGLLEINIVPDNVRLSLSSTAAGVDTIFNSSSAMVLALPVGTYRWSANAEDYETQSGTLNIDSNQPYELNLQLDETVYFGRLYANISPSDATIRLRNTSTGDTHVINNLETIDLREGTYAYEVSAERFLPVSSMIDINRDATRLISHTLESLSVNNLISRLRNIRTLTEARTLRRSIPDERPDLTIQQNERYYSALIEFAGFILDEGEFQLAYEIYELIIKQDYSNYSARLNFASVLKANTPEFGNISELRDYYDRIREILRPVFGQLLNLVPVEDRQEIEFRARYAHAESYYLQFYDYDETDFENRRRVGSRAYGELQDFLTRYQRLSEHAKNLLVEEYQKAQEYRDVIATDLGI